MAGLAKAAPGRDADARRYLEEAIQHMKTARQLNPKHPYYLTHLSEYYRDLTGTLARLAAHQDLAKAAAEGQLLDPDNLEEYCRAAAFLAHCLAFADKDTALSAAERKACGQRYGEQALDYLRKAKGKKSTSKSFDPSRWRQEFQDLLRESPVFAPVRQQDIFRKLLQELNEAGS